MDKTEYILNKIQQIFPNKMILNGNQTAKVLGISTRQFSRLVSNEEFDRLPKFKSEDIHKKDGRTSRKYQFNIVDIAEFLAN